MKELELDCITEIATEIEKKKGEMLESIMRHYMDEKGFPQPTAETNKSDYNIAIVNDWNYILYKSNPVIGCKIWYDYEDQIIKSTISNVFPEMILEHYKAKYNIHD